MERRKVPLFNPKVLKNWGFNVGVVEGVIQNLALAGILFIFPLYLGAVHGYEAVDIGIFMMPMSLAILVLSLGATKRQAAVTVLAEARLGVIVAIAAGFGSIISEVGAVMLVGGNIEGKTRVLTTAIVLETRKGNFELALALGVILLGLAFLANFLMLRLQGRSVNG